MCATEELDAGEMIGAKLGKLPIVVVRLLDGSLHALADRCLHHGGPLHRGVFGGRGAAKGQVGDYSSEREGEILRCPWHGYEYDVRTGCTLFDPDRALRTFEVREQDGRIVVAR